MLFPDGLESGHAWSMLPDRTESSSRNRQPPSMPHRVCSAESAARHTYGRRPDRWGVRNSKRWVRPELYPNRADSDKTGPACGRRSDCLSAWTSPAEVFVPPNLFFPHSNKDWRAWPAGTDWWDPLKLQSGIASRPRANVFGAGKNSPSPSTPGAIWDQEKLLSDSFAPPQ